MPETTTEKKKVRSGSQRRQVVQIQTHIPTGPGLLFKELRLVGKGLTKYRLAQALVLEGLARFEQMPPDERPGKLALLLQRHGIETHQTRLKS